MATPPADPPPPPTLAGNTADLSVAQRNFRRGRQALLLSALGYGIPGLLIAAAFLADFGGLLGGTLGFFGFPLMQLVALVMGLTAVRVNTGRIATALASVGLVGWGWLLYQILSRPLIKLF